MKKVNAKKSVICGIISGACLTLIFISVLTIGSFLVEHSYNSKSEEIKQAEPLIIETNKQKKESKGKVIIHGVTDGTSTYDQEFYGKIEKKDGEIHVYIE